MARILIVDDESAVREVTGLAIADARHTIEEAGDAQSALAAMASHPADVVISDVQMPGESGLWLTAQIRNTYPLTAVILATGISTVPATITLRAGVVSYLVKPFTRAALLNALSLALAWHDETKASGPRSQDRGDVLQAWLDSIEDV